MIPPFQKYLYPFLELMGDGKVRNYFPAFIYVKRVDTGYFEGE